METRVDELLLGSGRPVDRVDPPSDVCGVRELAGEELEARRDVTRGDRGSEEDEVAPEVGRVGGCADDDVTLVVLDLAAAELEHHEVGAETERGDLHRASVSAHSAE